MAHGMFGGDDCYEKPPGKLTEREDGMTNCDCDENDMYCPHGKLTDNSQSKYAAERSAYADRGLEPDDDKLTPNISTEPPILTNSSDDQSPSCDPFIGQAGVYHPTSDPMARVEDTNPDHQSVKEAMKGDFDPIPEGIFDCIGADVAAQQMEQAGLTLRDLPPIRHGESIIAYAARISPQEREVFEKHCAGVLNDAFAEISDQYKPRQAPNGICIESNCSEPRQTGSVLCATHLAMKKSMANWDREKRPPAPLGFGPKAEVSYPDEKGGTDANLDKLLADAYKVCCDTGRRELADDIDNYRVKLRTPTSDVYIKDFNTPAERVVPPPDKNYIDIVFDGAPSPIDGPPAGRFIEVEDMAGRSISIGEWVPVYVDGIEFWHLRIPDHRKTAAQLRIVTKQLNKWTRDFAFGISSLKNQKDRATAHAFALKEEVTEVRERLNRATARAIAAEAQKQVLKDENVMLKAQNDALVTQDINHKTVHTLNGQRIKELRATNQQILNHDRLLIKQIEELKRQLHAARSDAVQERQNPRRTIVPKERIGDQGKCAEGQTARAGVYEGAHMQSGEQGAGKYSCVWCPEQFTSQAALNNHEMTLHPDKDADAGTARSRYDD